MALLGELDCDRLCEGALRYLAEMKETATSPEVTELSPAGQTGTDSPPKFARGHPPRHRAAINQRKRPRPHSSGHPKIHVTVLCYLNCSLRH
jgi:hypothetical protein